MELLRGIHNLNAQYRGCVLSTGGGFNKSDGIYLRHQAVLSLELFALKVSG